MRDLCQRTKAFALQVFKFCDTLPRTQAGRIVGNQLMRSASSVGANYRAAQRAHSRAAFIAKLSIVEEEADESLFWLELLGDLKLGEPATVQALQGEAHQLVAIIVAAKKSSRRKKK